MTSGAWSCTPSQQGGPVQQASPRRWRSYGHCTAPRASRPPQSSPALTQQHDGLPQHALKFQVTTSCHTGVLHSSNVYLVLKTLLVQLGAPCAARCTLCSQVHPVQPSRDCKIAWLRITSAKVQGKRASCWGKPLQEASRAGEGCGGAWSAVQPAAQKSPSAACRCPWSAGTAAEALACA